MSVTLWVPIPATAGLSALSPALSRRFLRFSVLGASHTRGRRGDTSWLQQVKTLLLPLCCESGQDTVQLGMSHRNRREGSSAFKILNTVRLSKAELRAGLKHKGCGS